MSLPKIFSAAPSSAKLYSISIYPPNDSKAATIKGHGSPELVSPLFQTMLRVGVPFAPENFRRTVEYYPVFTKKSDDTLKP